MSTNTTVKMKSFVKEFIAVVVGDDATAKGEKVFRQASSALNTQIASLKGDLISKEDALEEAKDAQKLARVNKGNFITDRNDYVAQLLSAKNTVTQAEEALELHKKKIAFLESELASLNADV